MRKYETWIGGLKNETSEVIEAESSFAARKIKASKHTACEVSDVAARWVEEGQG
jgi:hypothetical protein